jgi:putative Ca2+/H+ antiporter (TMEM165/GDT1 family)
MNFAVLFTTFGLVFIGELPDKTMFATLVMSARAKPSTVWLGAAFAFVIHVAIAITVGEALFLILPRRAVDILAAVLFAGGAVYAARAQDEGEEPTITRKQYQELRVFGASALTIFIAEWGDLTQIITANLALRFHSPLSVGLGALAALWLVAGIAVTLSQRLLRRFNPVVIRRSTSVILIGLAIWMAVEAVNA